jgi:hypothetical protein
MQQCTLYCIIAVTDKTNIAFATHTALVNPNATPPLDCMPLTCIGGKVEVGGLVSDAVVEDVSSLTGAGVEDRGDVCEAGPLFGVLVGLVIVTEVGLSVELCEAEAATVATLVAVAVGLDVSSTTAPNEPKLVPVGLLSVGLNVLEEVDPATVGLGVCGPNVLASSLGAAVGATVGATVTPLPVVVVVCAVGATVGLSVVSSPWFVTTVVLLIVNTPKDDEEIVLGADVVDAIVGAAVGVVVVLVDVGLLTGLDADIVEAGQPGVAGQYTVSGVGHVHESVLSASQTKSLKAGISVGQVVSDRCIVSGTGSAGLAVVYA